LRTVPGNRITVDHGDTPGGFGGVDSVRHPGSGAGTPNSTATGGRSRSKLNNNRSTRPQP
jgi:hypothetical protein